MKSLRIARYAFAALAACLTLSCEKKTETDQPSEETKVTFKVAVNKTEANKAEVIVRHDGKNTDTWYGFVTEDLSSTEASLIQAELANVDKSALHIGKEQTVSVNNLKENTRYRYIAFGVTENKDLYGTPGSIAFSTNPNLNVTFTVSAADVTASSAKVTVSHTGADYLTYYGIQTADLDRSDATVAADAFAEIVKDGALQSGVKLFSGTKTEVELSGLAPDTPYRYVVFGVFVDADGKAVYYGTPASASFTTLVDYASVAFTAQVVSTERHTASIKVGYEAISELTWVGINTTDLTTDAATLIAAAVKDVKEADYKKGNDVTVTLEGLTANTQYRYIVTGIKADGAYGIPAEVKYATADEDYNSVAFSAELVSADINSATVKVWNSTQSESLQWIYVLTTDTNSSADALLPAASSVKASDVQTGQKNISFTGLTGNTTYRVIVKGYRVDSAGAKYLYGTHADISFSTESFYKQEPTWTVSVDKVDHDDEYPFMFTNTVAAGSTAGKYFFSVYTQETVNNYDGDLAALLEDKMEEEIAYFDYLMEKYPQYYTSYSDLLFEGTDSQDYWALGYGTWFVLAIGLTDDGQPTGKFAYTRYLHEPSEEDKAAYNQWLGPWKVERGGASELWTVEEDVVGETYLISNFEGEVIMAEFDVTTRSMFIYTQEEVTSYKSGSYGLIKVGLYGNILYTDGNTYYVTGSYPITSISMNADGKTATMTPYTVTLSGGDEFTLTGMQLRHQITSGQYEGYTLNSGYEPVLLPGTISRPSDQGSAAYNKWLGDWEVIGRNVKNTADSTFFTMSLEQQYADVNYTAISDWGIFNGGVEATFPYENSTGKLMFPIVTLAEQVKVFSDTDELFDLALCGFFTAEGDNYYDDTEGQVLARATISSDGNSATTAAGSYDIQGKYPYNSINMMAVGEDGAYRLWYPANLDIPFKMKRVSGAANRPAARPAVTGHNVSKGAVSKKAPMAGKPVFASKRFQPAAATKAGATHKVQR